MPALLASLVAFGFGFVGSIPLTGPVAVWVMSRAAQRQFRMSLRIGLGAAVAEALYAAIAFWGFSTFLAQHQGILTATHAVSATVLILLGLYFMRWRLTAQATPEHPQGMKGFLVGFTVSLLNPTLLATWSAAVAMLYSRQLLRFSGWLAVPFGLSAGAGVATWEVVWIALLRRHQHRLPERALQWIIRGMGGVLLLAGVYAGVDFFRAWVKA